jgi:hypothetical protein
MTRAQFAKLQQRIQKQVSDVQEIPIDHRPTVTEIAESIYKSMGIKYTITRNGIYPAEGVE